MTDDKPRAGGARAPADGARGRRLRQSRDAADPARPRTQRSRRRLRDRARLRHPALERLVRRDPGNLRHPAVAEGRAGPAGRAAAGHAPAARHARARIMPPSTRRATWPGPSGRDRARMPGPVSSMPCCARWPGTTRPGWADVIRGDRAADDPEWLATRWSHPSWIVRAMRDSLGRRRGELADLLAADNVPARPGAGRAARPAWSRRSCASCPASSRGAGRHWPQWSSTGTPDAACLRARRARGGAGRGQPAGRTGTRARSARRTRPDVAGRVRRAGRQGSGARGPRPRTGCAARRRRAAPAPGRARRRRPWRPGSTRSC